MFGPMFSTNGSESEPTITNNDHPHKFGSGLGAPAEPHENNDKHATGQDVEKHLPIHMTTAHMPPDKKGYLSNLMTTATFGTIKGTFQTSQQ